MNPAVCLVIPVNIYIYIYKHLFYDSQPGRFKSVIGLLRRVNYPREMVRVQGQRQANLSVYVMVNSHRIVATTRGVR